ncbi:SDR family NAD(P)-dependent oxidoreductase [Gordonia polyisoprenivorans]|uniref:SDR family NAD(P)-dependent oxidoreductase n=1 Tax=Gordonia polyisoprenivorans TaxID=84595 RepID=UPI001AD67D6D|nr:SDR family oxidoreductase [Gordonia polyisoprenivorans]QTI69921.1 SDR family oxidoreductase [Gordonia polyisoprenivorans]
MQSGLAGKIALVTGGSRGIGRASALALAAEGARVCVVGRDSKMLDEVVDRAEGSAVSVAADLSTEDGCGRAYDACVESWGSPDILVNCAGSAGMGPVLDLRRSDIDDALRLKLHGYLTMAQLVAPEMRRRGWGRIVNISGGAGASPTSTNLPTSLANVAVHNLTRALSDELSADGVLVNVVAPGLTCTDRAADLFRAAAEDTGRDVDALIAEAGAEVPAGRAAGPEEVAAVVYFLSSELCSYIHGSAIYMDGGARRSTP